MYQPENLLLQGTKLVAEVHLLVVTMETEGLAWSYRIAFGNYRKNWKEKKQREINLREN